jgi:hypothetical protein
MLEIIELLIHLVVTFIKLLKPGGLKVVMAETIAMKQQLIVVALRHHIRLLSVSLEPPGENTWTSLSFSISWIYRENSSLLQ